MGDIMNRIEDLSVLFDVLKDMVVNGVLEDGVYRAPNIMDYYNITDINIKLIFSVFREAGLKFSNLHERTRLRTFVEKFSGVEFSIDVFTQKVMDEDLCIQGIVISEEMKRQAIEYFLINNIPLTYINYNVYIRGIVNSIKQEEQRSC